MLRGGRQRSLKHLMVRFSLLRLCWVNLSQGSLRFHCGTWKLYFVMSTPNPNILPVSYVKDVIIDLIVISYLYIFSQMGGRSHWANYRNISILYVRKGKIFYCNFWKCYSTVKLKKKLKRNPKDDGSYGLHVFLQICTVRLTNMFKLLCPPIKW